MFADVGRHERFKCIRGEEEAFHMRKFHNCMRGKSGKSTRRHFRPRCNILVGRSRRKKRGLPFLAHVCSLFLPHSPQLIIEQTNRTSASTEKREKKKPGKMCFNFSDTCTAHKTVSTHFIVTFFSSTIVCSVLSYEPFCWSSCVCVCFGVYFSDKANEIQNYKNVFEN